MSIPIENEPARSTPAPETTRSSETADRSSKLNDDDINNMQVGQSKSSNAEMIDKTKKIEDFLPFYVEWNE